MFLKIHQITCCKQIKINSLGCVCKNSRYAYVGNVSTEKSNSSQESCNLALLTCTPFQEFFAVNSLKYAEPLPTVASRNERIVKFGWFK